MKDSYGQQCKNHRRRPSALEVVTYAIVLLEDNSLINSGHSTTFTHDGINQLAATRSSASALALWASATCATPSF